MCEYVSCLGFQIYINAKRPVPYLLAMSYDNVGVVGVAAGMSSLCFATMPAALLSVFLEAGECTDKTCGSVGSGCSSTVHLAHTHPCSNSQKLTLQDPRHIINRCVLQQQQWLKQFAQGNQSITTVQLARQHSFDGAFELLRLSKATAAQSNPRVLQSG